MSSANMVRTMAMVLAAITVTLAFILMRLEGATVYVFMDDSRALTTPIISGSVPCGQCENLVDHPINSILFNNTGGATVASAYTVRDCKGPAATNLTSSDNGKCIPISATTGPTSIMVQCDAYGP